MERKNGKLNCGKMLMEKEIIFFSSSSSCSAPPTGVEFWLVLPVPLASSEYTQVLPAVAIPLLSWPVSATMRLHLWPGSSSSCLVVDMLLSCLAKVEKEIGMVGAS